MSLPNTAADPITLFAPTNAAFAQIPKENLKYLLKPEHKDVLKGLLLYHAYEGGLLSADAKNGVWVGVSVSVMRMCVCVGVWV